MTVKHLAGQKFEVTRRVNNLLENNFDIGEVLSQDGHYMVAKVKDAADEWLQREMCMDLREVDALTIRVTTTIEFVEESSG